MKEFDVAFTNQNAAMTMCIPAALARPLIAAGYNRAKLSLTEDGILVEPYVAETNSRGRNHRPVELPDWSKP